MNNENNQDNGISVENMYWSKTYKPNESKSFIDYCPSCHEIGNHNNHKFLCDICNEHYVAGDDINMNYDNETSSIKKRPNKIGVVGMGSRRIGKMAAMINAGMFTHPNDILVIETIEKERDINIGISSRGTLKEVVVSELQKTENIITQFKEYHFEDKSLMNYGNSNKNNRAYRDLNSEKKKRKQANKARKINRRKKK